MDHCLKVITKLRSGLLICVINVDTVFEVCINPICNCDLEIETATHFLLHCPLFQFARQSLLIIIKKIDESILKKHDEPITKTLSHNNGKLACLVASL